MNANRFSGMMDDYTIRWASSALHSDAAPRTSADLSPTQERYLRWRGRAEWLCAALLLVLTAPVMAVAMLLVRLTSPGPALYQQVRLGRDGKPFYILKIRTMGHNCESKTGPQWSKPGDTRITPLGKWLRALHIDELPQLVNVLRGEMSLIGPRPERPEIAVEIERTLEDFPCRLAVKPGITGFAQVQLPADTEVARVRHKLALDLHYIRTMNPLTDAVIAFCTVLKMFGVKFGIARWLLRYADAWAGPGGGPQIVVFSNGTRPATPAVPVREAA